MVITFALTIVLPRREALISAKVNVLAGERRFNREFGDAILVVGCPKVHGLSADEYETALEIRNFREDGSDVEIREVCHSSGFAPRRLMRTLLKTK